MTRRGFVIHHNGPPANCVGRSHDRCVSFWSGVRRWHMEGNGWSDIAYSFGVCPHGEVFTGRGWHKSQFANGSDQVGADDGRDSKWYTVLAFVGGGAHGGYDTGSPEEPVSPKMTAAIERLIYDGRARGFCGDRVLPHNAFKRKACPGPTLTRLAAQLDGTHAPDPAPLEDDMADYLAQIEAIYVKQWNRGLKPDEIIHYVTMLRTKSEGPQFVVNDVARQLKHPPIYT